jgi:signal transduction histidine kinase
VVADRRYNGADAISTSMTSGITAFEYRGGNIRTRPEAMVLLSVRSLTDGIELAVADTGRGIPPEDLPFIFEEFRQVEGQEQVAQEGSGLGLAIAKKSVELLGGTIQVESQVGTGTKFSLRIADYEGTQ